LNPFYFHYKSYYGHFTSKNIHIGLFGLIGYVENVFPTDGAFNPDAGCDYKVNKTLWCLIAFYRQTEKSTLLFVLPLFCFYQREEFRFILLVPIFASLTLLNAIQEGGHEFNLSYTSVLIFFFAYTKTEKGKLIDINTCIPAIISLDHSKFNGTTDFRFIYLFKIALCRYLVERSENYRDTHLYTKMLYVYPLFYWDIKSLRSKLSENHAKWKSESNEVDLLLNTYIEDEKHSNFDVLFLWKTYSIVHFEFDTTHFVYWILPFVFSSKFDALEHGNFYMKHKQFSILFLLHPYVSLYNHTSHIHKETEESKRMVFSIFYSNSWRNIVTNKRGFTFSLFWFLHPFVAFIKYRTEEDTILFYVQPLFLYFHEKNRGTTFVEILWLCHRRLSLIGWNSQKDYVQRYVFPYVYDSYDMKSLTSTKKV
jgi:hypothetical protein